MTRAAARHARAAAAVRLIYLLEGTDTNRRLVGRYIDVYEYADGRNEVRAGGVALRARLTTGSRD